MAFPLAFLSEDVGGGGGGGAVLVEYHLTLNGLMERLGNTLRVMWDCTGMIADELTNVRTNKGVDGRIKIDCLVAFHTRAFKLPIGLNILDDGVKVDIVVFLHSKIFYCENREPHTKSDLGLETE